MPQAEDDVPLASLAAGSGGPSDPDQSPLAASKDEQATPNAAPVTRPLRHTRSQSARKTAAASGNSDTKAKQAVEVSNGVDEEDVDILATSSASSGEVDITGSPAVATFAALHAALPLEHPQEEGVLPGTAEPNQHATLRQEGVAAVTTDAGMAADDKPAEDEQGQPTASGQHSNTAEAVEPAANPEQANKTPSGRGRGGRGRGRGVRGRGKGRGAKSKGRSKASDSASPKAPSEDQADFANELDSPSRNASDVAEQSHQPDPASEDVSISEVTAPEQLPANQTAEGSSQLPQGKSDASQVSRPDPTSTSYVGPADEMLASQTKDSNASKADDSKASKADDAKTSKADDSRASKPGAARTSKLDEPKPSVPEEPPAKRPRRAAAASTSQKEAKEVKGGGKARGKGAQARRGVVQESDADQSSEDINIVDQDEDVDIGTNDGPYEQPLPAEEMEIDEKPQAQSGKKRARRIHIQPSSKGRPRSGPTTAKDPALGTSKAGKNSTDGLGSAPPVAKPGKSAVATAAPGGPGLKEKRPSSEKQEGSQAGANTLSGDPAKQAAELQKGRLEEAMRAFEEARQAFEDARQALAQAADQVETSLSSIGQLSGLTMDILRDTQLGKAVSKLSKLAKLHPTITDCERISSKASEATTYLKRAVGVPTQGTGPPLQGHAQQLKKAAPKADSRLTSPSSPLVARTAPAAAHTAAPAVIAAAAVNDAANAEQALAAVDRTEKMVDGSHQQTAADARVRQLPSSVKVESASLASSPMETAVADAAQAAVRAAPGNAPAPRAEPGANSDALQAHPPSSQQHSKTADKLSLSRPQGNMSATAKTAVQYLGDPVRDKAVAILGLALTSPRDLTPQEAALAVEAAVFALFAEHGVAGMRYKRRLHTLWSYLRGTEGQPFVPKLREKVLQGEIMAKTLARIDRAQAQQLCNLKSSSSTQQQQPPKQQQPVAQHQQQLPHYPLQHQMPQQTVPAPPQAQPQQQLHPWQHASSAPAPAVPFSTAGTYPYGTASAYQPSWHNPHQQPYGVAGPGVMPGQHVPPPGAAPPPFHPQATALVPPPPPADDPLPPASFSEQMESAPPPPTEDPPDPPVAPQSQGKELLPASALPLQSMPVPGPPSSKKGADSTSSPALGPGTVPAVTSQARNGSASQAGPEVGRHLDMISNAQAASKPPQSGSVAQVASVMPSSANVIVRDSVSEFAEIGSDFSDSDRPPGVDVEGSGVDVMDTA